VSETKNAVPFLASLADREVPAKAQRRKFGAEDKKRILDEVDRAAGHGGIGATKSQHTALMTDQYSFLLWQLGDAEFQMPAGASKEKSGGRK